MTNIIISGLTAAGKTTHAEMLATAFQMNYVSASDVFRRLMNVDGPYWRPEWDDLRASGELDKEVDRQMADDLAKAENTVFDAWALPWTSSEPALRIWLESDLESRARKVVVSRLRSQEGAELSVARQIALDKDSQSRDRFKGAHGFDLFSDHEIFDLRFDLSELIPTTTVAVSDLGIGFFAPLLHLRVAQELGLRLGDQLITDRHRSLERAPG